MMKLERVVVTSENESTICERAMVYLQRINYKQASSQQPFLVYERGSLLGSFISFSPRSWKCQATIQITSDSAQVTHVSINLDINTTGQIVTEKERDFWHCELDELEAVIMNGNIEAISSKEITKSSLVENLVAGLVIIVISLGTAMLARWIFESRLISYLGLVFGIGISVWVVGWFLKFKVR